MRGKAQGVDRRGTFLHCFHLLEQLNDVNLMNSFKSEKFDIALGENFDACYYGLTRRIGIKNYITISSTAAWEQVMMYLGIPSAPSFVPGNFMVRAFPN